MITGSSKRSGSMPQTSYDGGGGSSAASII